MMTNSRLLVQERLSAPWPIIVVTEDGRISVVYSHDELRWATGSQSPLGYSKAQLRRRAHLGPAIGCVAFSHAVDNEQLIHDTENVFAAKILNASSPEFITTVRAALLTTISDPIVSAVQKSLTARVANTPKLGVSGELLGHAGMASTTKSGKKVSIDADYQIFNKRGNTVKIGWFFHSKELIFRVGWGEDDKYHLDLFNAGSAERFHKW